LSEHAEPLLKVRYRGLAKNTARLYPLFGLANLVIARRKLGATHARIASWFIRKGRNASAKQQ
jgi:hypothetical protein